MTDLSDNEALLALMYDSNPEPEPTERKGPAPANPIMNLAALSHKVYRLEREMDEKDRAIKRLQQRIRTIERNTSQVGRAVNDLGREMGNKLDRRGD